MCGIAGLWNVNCERPLASVNAMLDAMHHRGPDGRGTLEYAGGAAGMVRLALVDLSPRGQQPMWSPDGRVAILFNGEIYNFRSERARLEKLGHQFRTTTDTEVILHLYLEHGLDFYKYLRGMYAIALFDWRQTRPEAQPVMILVRGPLGIKPLYVAQPNGDGRGVLFSSEVRALLASGLVRPEVDMEGLASYLTQGFIVQPATMIEGVRMMDPATLERYVPGEEVQRIRFWHLPEYTPRRETLDQAADRLRAVIDESVSLHALADAPIGAFLSGGVDSTGIVGLMRQHVSDLRTYTLQFPDIPGEDEVREAVAAAKVYQCQHTVVQVTSQEVAEALPRFAGDIDQPSADGLNTWLISRAAARDVKGVLSGVGGDEWFAGYPATRRMTRYKNTVIGQMQAVAGQAANLLAPWISNPQLAQKAENLATRRNSLTSWLQGHTVFQPRMARDLAGLRTHGLTAEQKFSAILAEDCADWRKESPIGLSCLLDTSVYMGDQLLRDCDATSMAHSLELRVPFVDLALAEFSRSCADEYKLRPDGGSTNRYYGSGSKRVLIHALRDLLPLAISNRPKKGFSLPYEHWMRGALAPTVAETCSDASVRERGLLDPALVARIREHSQGNSPAPAYPGLWTLMILELWCRAVLDPYRRPAPHALPLGV